MTDLKRIHAKNFNQTPRWFNMLNTAWKGGYPLGMEVKITKDHLIAAARKETGLHDLGADFWDEPLDRLLDSINKEANLHPIGRFITKKRLVNLLSIRLRAEEYFKKYPEILQQELYPVTVVMGLQRTGTTKLQRLLGSDPETRALRSWEALNPSPIKGDDHTGKERIKFAKMSEQALKKMSPGFFAIHPVEHLAPEEDVLLLDVSFLSTTSEATMHVPSYASWLEQTDQSSAYIYSAKLLKFLQWQRPAKRWVLKTPHHLEFPHLADQYFGEVQFVWTHRNVYDAIPSFLSMLNYSRVLFSKEVDPKVVASHWLKKIAVMLQTSMKYRTNPVNNAKFTDVFYEEFLRDSFAVLDRIYANRGQVIGSELRDFFKQEEANSPQGKYGLHDYDLSDFGIDKSMILEYTSGYQEFQENLRKY